MAERQTGMTPTREDRRRDVQQSQGRSSSPFRAIQRMVDDLDRVFGDFTSGRRSGNSLLGQSGAQLWIPDVDVSQRENELTITVDLPGMKRDEISVEVTDETVRIEGERQREREDDREGVYRLERSYGTFHRVVPLPEGAITDEARASFRDGVLEIKMPCPPTSTSGRRLEIADEGNKR